MRFFFFLLVLLSVNSYSQDLVRLRLRLENINQVGTEALIAFKEDATDGVDIQYDAPLLQGNSNLALYTINIGGSYHPIQAWPTLTNYKIIPLGFTNTIPGISKIYVNLFENFDESVLIYLEDTELGILHKIVSNYYEFNNTSVINNDTRFKLHFYAPILISTVDDCGDRGVGKISINTTNTYQIDAKLKIDDLVIDTVSFIGNYNFIGLVNDSYTLEMSYLDNENIENIDINSPMTSAVATSTTDSALITDSQIEFIGSVQGASTFFWNFGDGNVFYNDLNPVHTFTNIGSYEVYFTAESGDCISIDTLNIIIFDINNVIDNYMDISIFPNPAFDVVKLKSENIFSNANVRIFNINGSLVSSTFIKNYTDMSIPINDLSTGIYDLIIEYGNGNRFSKKIIKR